MNEKDYEQFIRDLLPENKQNCLNVFDELDKLPRQERVEIQTTAIQLMNLADAYNEIVEYELSEQRSKEEVEKIFKSWEEIRINMTKMFT